MQLEESDDVITAEDIKSLALDRLSTIPIEGIEGSPLDADPILEVVLRAAVGRTSVWHVCDQTENMFDGFDSPIYRNDRSKTLVPK